VYVFDARTGRKVSESEFQRGDELSGETGTKSVVAFSPDGKAIATLVRGIVLLNDAGTGRQLLKLPAGANSNYVSLAISPNGARLTTGDEKGRVKVWEAASGRRVAQFSGW
jgi:WD40 repeat protein